MFGYFKRMELKVDRVTKQNKKLQKIVQTQKADVQLLIEKIDRLLTYLNVDNAVLDENDPRYQRLQTYTKEMDKLVGAVVESAPTRPEGIVDETPHQY